MTPESDRFRKCDRCSRFGFSNYVSPADELVLICYIPDWAPTPSMFSASFFSVAEANKLGADD